MKAMLSKRVGGPDTLELEELPDPTPGAGEGLLAVKACGVNSPDSLIIEDRYQLKPTRPFAPGGEIAGVVEAVGDGVEEWVPGDRVIAVTAYGGLAEQVIVEASRLHRLPDACSAVEGAALLLTYATALHALVDRGKVSAGD